MLRLFGQFGMRARKTIQGWDTLLCRLKLSTLRSPPNQSRDPGVIFKSTFLPSRWTVMPISLPTFSSPMMEV